MSETLKIEPGKFYKTRDGRKAFVASIAHPNPFGATCPNPIAGYVANRNDAWPIQWDECGRRASGDMNLDLIAPWTEPRKWTVLMYEVNGAAVSSMYAIYDQAYKLLARVEVTEGQGVEDQR